MSEPSARLEGALRAIEAEISDIEAELEAKRADIAQLEARFRRLRVAQEALLGTESSSGQEPHAQAQSRSRRIVEIAIQAMRRHGRPLNRREVFEEVTSAGIDLPGPDKPKRVGMTLIKSRRFENISGRGYWPKGNPVPAGEDWILPKGVQDVEGGKALERHR